MKNRREREIKKFLSRWYPQKPLTDPFDVRLIALAKSRITTLADYLPLVEPWFTFPDKDICTDNGRLMPIAEMLYVHIECVSNWTPETIHNIIRTMMKETGNKKIGKDLTRLFTGKDNGLPLTDVLPLIGFIETQQRIVRLFSASH